MKTHFAALTFAIDKASASRVQLLPAGEFRATDGRPAAPTKAWRTDARVAAALSAKLAARSNDVVLDYEHQSLLSRTNGQPAPAAGWFKGLEWIEGKVCTPPMCAGRIRPRATLRPTNTNTSAACLPMTLRLASRKKSSARH